MVFSLSNFLYIITRQTIRLKNQKSFAYAVWMMLNGTVIPLKQRNISKPIGTQINVLRMLEFNTVKKNGKFDL